MTDSPTANAAQQAYWNDAAGQTWSELHDALDRQLEPLGKTAMTALEPQPGERLVDVGCGTGQTALALADLAAPGGRVLGVDISRLMLDVARARKDRSNAVRFLEADAQTHAFEPGTADGVFSRFGVMFFADPPAAFANLRKALKPEGRLAFICWRSLAENPWMTPPLSAFADQPPPPPPDPDAPGPFAFADPDRVRGILAGAGFTEIELTAHDPQIGGNTLEDTVRLSLRVGPLGALLRERPQAREAVVEELRNVFANRLRDGLVYQAGACWIVTARNPR